jgi:integrase/recombinase XerC
MRLRRMTMLKDAIATWLRALRVNGYAENTVSNYERDLRQFREFAAGSLGREPGLADCTRDLIDARLGELRTRLATASVERNIFCLRAFWKWADASGLASNPIRLMLRPRVTARRLPQYLDEKEIAALLAGPTRCDASAVREQAIIETLYSTGIRVAELVHLDWRDIDAPDTGFLMIRSGKGDKDRIVPIGEPALDAIASWRAASSPCDPDAAVFRNRRGGRLTTRAVEYIVRQRADAAGIERRVYPHALRHTFATHLLRHGAGLMDIAEMLGHANVSTTTRYTHVNIDYLRRQHRRLGRGSGARENNRN